jgi:hypothetical protein
VSEPETTAPNGWPEPLESLALSIHAAHPSLMWLYEHPMLCRGMARAALDYLTPEERERIANHAAWKQSGHFPR